MAATRLLTPLSRIETRAGTAVWRTLDWDTCELGIPTARLDVLEVSGAHAEARNQKLELLSLVLDECREAGIRYLSARVDTGNLTSIHALEKTGFELIDGIQTFAISLGLNHSTVPPDTRLFAPQDLPLVLEIGRTAFAFDRFHADPVLLPKVADQINESWTRNCCLGISADSVLVAEEEGRVASYVACRTDHEKGSGIIVLVATAEWARQRGAARRVSSAALHWFSAQGLKSVEVGTQLRNIPAARLYESLGFRLIRTSLTFRRIL